MIIFISNLGLCHESKFLLKVREASLAGVNYIYLRENDLSDRQYKDLALSCMQMMIGTKTELVVCHRDHIADQLNLKKHNRFHEKTESSFTVSTHTLDEVKEVKGYYLYSPIFETLCKPGVKAKGLNHYESKMIALGGINQSRLNELTNINHVALMSEWLIVEDVFNLVKTYKKYGY